MYITLKDKDSQFFFLSSCQKKTFNAVLFDCRGKHGVGRIDIVENRQIGMKSRGK